VALSNARLGAFVLLAAGAALVLGRDELAGTWLALPAVAFLIAVALHRRESGLREGAARAVAFYERGLARLGHRLAAGGATGERFARADHPYAAQLDLFGPGSLYALLCGARTERGQETLAHWLLEPAHPDEIRSRQAAIRELTPRLDLREELAVRGRALSDPVDRSGLGEWTTRPDARVRTPVRILLVAALNVAALASWILLGTGAGPLLGLAALEIPLWVALRPRVRVIVAALQRPAAQLDLVTALLERLEQERFETPRLAGLLRDLGGAGLPASRHLRRLRLLVDLLESRRNQMFAAIAPLGLWTTQLAFAVEAWRRAHGESVRRWLEAVGELEALLDLASFAWEHPDDPFPELVEPGPSFVAEGLGHPLIPDERCAARRPAAALGRERVQHVGQEHAVAEHRDQRGARTGRLPGAGARAAPLAAGGRGVAARARLAPGGGLALPGRGPARAPDRGPGLGGGAPPVPAR
jgi:hypothetical protein